MKIITKQALAVVAVAGALAGATGSTAWAAGGDADRSGDNVVSPFETASELTMLHHGAADGVASTRSASVTFPALK